MGKMGKVDPRDSEIEGERLVDFHPEKKRPLVDRCEIVIGDEERTGGRRDSGKATENSGQLSTAHELREIDRTGDTYKNTSEKKLWEETLKATGCCFKHIQKNVSHDG